MWRDDPLDVIDPQLIPCLFVELGLFTLTTKPEVRNIFQLSQTQVFGNSCTYDSSYVRQTLLPARLIGEDHTEVECRMLRPVAPSTEADVHDVRGESARDSVDLLLSGKSGDHKTPDNRVHRAEDATKVETLPQSRSLAKQSPKRVIHR